MNMNKGAAADRCRNSLIVVNQPPGRVPDGRQNIRSISMRAIVSVLGQDKPGIIAHISHALYEANANILDITQTVLRDEVFAMTMLVDLAAMKVSFEQLKEQLGAAERRSASRSA